MNPKSSLDLSRYPVEVYDAKTDQTMGDLFKRLLEEGHITDAEHRVLTEDVLPARRKLRRVQIENLTDDLVAAAKVYYGS